MSSVPIAGGGRPAVLSLSVKDAASLHAAYMPFVENGGLFIPSARSHVLGDQVFMLLNLPDEGERLAVAGTVVWITPPGPQGKRIPGIGVQFNDRDNAARARIEKQLACLPNTDSLTHTL